MLQGGIGVKKQRYNPGASKEMRRAFLHRLSQTPRSDNSFVATGTYRDMGRGLGGGLKDS